MAAISFSVQNKVLPHYRGMQFIEFNKEDIALVQYRLKRLLDSRRKKGAEAFGFSHYRTHEQRTDDKFLSNVLDGLTGQLGNFAICKFFFPPKQASSLYIETRNKADSDPLNGDKGSDIAGYYVDIKTSKILIDPSLHLSQKALSGENITLELEKNPNIDRSMKIFPRERHPGIAYVRAFAFFSFEVENSDSEFLEDKVKIFWAKVGLKGFIPEKEISGKQTKFWMGNRRLSAYSVEPFQLHPMADMYLKDWEYSRVDYLNQQNQAS